MTEIECQPRPVENRRFDEQRYRIVKKLLMGLTALILIGTLLFAILGVIKIRDVEYQDEHDHGTRGKPYIGIYVLIMVLSMVVYALQMFAIFSDFLWAVIVFAAIDGIFAVLLSILVGFTIVVLPAVLWNAVISGLLMYFALLICEKKKANETTAV